LLACWPLWPPWPPKPLKPENPEKPPGPNIPSAPSSPPNPPKPNDEKGSFPPKNVWKIRLGSMLDSNPSVLNPPVGSFGSTPESYCLLFSGLLSTV